MGLMEEADGKSLLTQTAGPKQLPSFSDLCTWPPKLELIIPEQFQQVGAQKYVCQNQVANLEEAVHFAENFLEAK